MNPPKRFVVRFAVGSPAGPRSGVWRLWTGTGRSDVYIAARTLGGVVKVSLHESGEWHHAFTKEYAADRGSPLLHPDGDRVVERWTRPREFVPGFTMAFMIIVPSTEVTIPGRPLPGRYAKDVIWVDPPTQGFATYFRVILSSPEATSMSTSGWPGRDGMETQLLARTELTNGETLWVVTNEEAVSSEKQEQLEDYRRVVAQNIEHNLEADASSALLEPRVWVYGSDPFGTRFFIDVSGGFLRGQ